MIASVRGTLADVGPGWVVVEAGGIGYMVQVSSHTAASLTEKGREVFLRTRHIVREDAVMLFGFVDPDELKLFDLIIGVSGVGPRLALALLSGLTPQALARAIRREEVGALVAVQGIGRKTAERLIVELREKVESIAGAAAPRGAATRRRHGPHEDAVAALVRLGYTAPQAREAVRDAGEETDEPTLEDLVRRALARLGKAAGQAAGR